MRHASPVPALPKRREETAESRPKEDLIHQHVLYVLRKNPDVARRGGTADRTIIEQNLEVMTKDIRDLSLWIFSFGFFPTHFWRLRRVQQVTEGVYLIDGQEAEHLSSFLNYQSG